MSEPHKDQALAREMSAGGHRRLDFRPGIGMWWEITRSTEDTSGNCSRPRTGRAADARAAVHVHPTAEESYEVIEGELEVFMNGDWSAVRAGEKATCLRGCRIRFATRARSPCGL
jgi:mannose-6-phosphate isomerase-like protein (cupin superfamily)